MQLDLILKKGKLVDYASNLEAIKDIGIVDGKIARIEDDIDPGLGREAIDLKGALIVPGIIDPHVHVSEWLGGQNGHKMLAQSGVTTALDLSGPIDGVLEFARDYGAGLNIACINYVRPGHTVSSETPSKTELKDLLQGSLSKGAIGYKLLGGHYPLTPEGTRQAIEVANENKAYVAFHAGTTESASNLTGMEEAIKLAGRDNYLHLAHINSYCRGKVLPVVEEVKKALELLTDHPNIHSESYLSPYNGTSSECVDGVPASNVTKTCLDTGGYPATEDGLRDAIMDGWAQIVKEVGGTNQLVYGEEGISRWRANDTDGTLSFPVNPYESRVLLGGAKTGSGRFVVDCFSSDGGGIPRNEIIPMGLMLVKLGVLSLKEFVYKSSYRAAELLRLENKGRIELGADADLTVIDYDTCTPEITVSNGHIAMYHGLVYPRPSTMIVTGHGKDYVTEKGLATHVITFD